MLYRDFQGLRLSTLGFGAMRLPCVEGSDTEPDQAAVDEMVDYALAQGVNYFDTAWGYHGGRSEVVIGRSLARHPRDAYFLADKFPGYDLANMGKVEEIFEEQLRKTGAGHFDFYLFHNVCEKNVDEYLNPANGILDYLLGQRRAGRIRHLGFSAHGDLPCLTRFLDAYGEHMEFCQLQINYLDWEFQNARGKVELMRSRGIPVWVMEPVRGGKLTQLSEENAAILAEARPDESPAGWAFRFVQGIPEVVVTLSGMSNLEQLRQNVATFSEERPLGERDRAALGRVVGNMLGRHTVPCTACRYCTDHCPMGLDIPKLLELYNEAMVTGGDGGFIPSMYVSTLPKDKRPGACVGCGSCAAVCPQRIDIPGTLADFASRLAG
ncbi:aldo/keto reductase [Olsenella sp. DSM 107455]|uniref:Aldo/keto reductase n=1 Tax=Thermophilibacter gallinarum TaxID=2779357 RepID=A0ABR9QSX7_9ACTN|nr:aldo/keto reductase [Thermophilibacter gallinarum]MBE5024173.1 aldo/keto reductase [Thermophilibacter gallinarum]